MCNTDDRVHELIIYDDVDGNYIRVIIALGFNAFFALNV